MYAIECEATVHNGMIRVPVEYLSKLQSSLRVIVLQDVVKSEARHSKKEEFLANVAQHRFNLPAGYKFRRDELYDRV